MQYIEILGKAAAVMRRLAALSLAAFMTFLSALTLCPRASGIRRCRRIMFCLSARRSARRA